MKDYSYFEGKELIVVYDVDGKYQKFNATVTGCEYDIGISIEAVTEEDRYTMETAGFNSPPYFFCIQGPQAPDFKYTASYMTGKYDEYFKEWMKMLEDGIVYYSTDDKIRKRLFDEVDNSLFPMASCAFT